MTEQFQHIVETQGRGIYDITRAVTDKVAQSAITTGLCHLFVQHTSASLIVCENADPAVRHDLETFFSTLVPDGDPMFTHIDEGKDDMPAHVRSILTNTGLTIPIRDGRCVLGTWQGLYLYEHRYAAHRRKITLTLVGD